MQRTAEALSLKVGPDAIDALVEAIGADSTRLESELRNLSLRDSTNSAARVQELVGGRSTNALAVGDALLEGNPGEAISRWGALIDAGEPARAAGGAGYGHDCEGRRNRQSQTHLRDAQVAARSPSQTLPLLTRPPTGSGGNAKTRQPAWQCLP